MYQVLGTSVGNCCFMIVTISINICIEIDPLPISKKYCVITFAKSILSSWSNFLSLRDQNFFPSSELWQMVSRFARIDTGAFELESAIFRLDEEDACSLSNASTIFLRSANMGASTINSTKLSLRY
uniref:(northern house mosquito) hypothetical protein n=1 Tax=Culex pipiens TaxID=7175 RepID=A0A8D8JXT4_CULPI